jgi:pyrroline-5-carboxylate reductase
VFLTMEAMVDAAVHIGFPRDMAVKLVTTTIRGSASFAMQSEDTIGMLRNKVWSDEKVYYFVRFQVSPNL